jgi:hypothetical protein
LLLPCAALVWRRTRLPVLLITCVGLLVLQLREYVEPPPIFLSLLAASYAAGAYCRRAGILTGLVILVGYLVTVHVDSPAAPPPIDEAIGVASIVAGTPVLGRSLGLGRAYTAQLEQRAADLARSREAELRGVVAEERARSPATCDVVAHHVSVMTVQAAAAAASSIGIRSAVRRRWPRSKPPAAPRWPRCRIVGIMRDPMTMLCPIRPRRERRSPAGRALHPDHQIGESASGLAAGNRRAAAAVGRADLAAYRIVQEALTNSLRHAGPTTAEVELRTPAGS